MNRLRRWSTPRRLAAWVAAVVLVAAGAGCNTIEGAGKDIKATGSAIEKAAGKAKTY